MNRSHIIGILFFLCLNFYGQSHYSDTTYKNLVNQNYTGDVNETGVNASRVINQKLYEITRQTDGIEQPEGWDELLKQAEIEEKKERKEKQKKDSIRNELEYKAKVAFIEKQEIENFKDKMVGYVAGMVLLFLLIVILKKLIKYLKEKASFNSLNVNISKRNLLDIKEISQKEGLFISIAIGLIISIISGSLFCITKYYRFYKGTSVEVSKEISSYELCSFNYLLAIVCFVLFTGIGYFCLKNKKADKIE